MIRKLYICTMLAILIAVPIMAFSQFRTATVVTPANLVLGVRNVSATALHIGDAVKPDTSALELLPDSASGAPGTSTAPLVKNAWRFALPETTTVSRDTLPGFVLWSRNTGSTGGGTDSIKIIGIKPYEVGRSLTNGKTDTSVYLVNTGGDSTFYYDTYISVSKIYCNTAQTNLDTLRFYQTFLYGVSKADSADGNEQIGVVGPSRADSIVARGWGRIQVRGLGGAQRVVMNGNTTKCYPWDKVRFGTSGFVKHTEKVNVITPFGAGVYTGTDSTIITPTAIASGDSTYGFAIDYTGTTADTTWILPKMR